MEWMTMELLRRKLPMDIPIPEFVTHTEDFAYKMKWISVKERLPEMGQWVLAYCESYPGNHPPLDLLQYCKDMKWLLPSDEWGYRAEIEQVSHWMPLPTPPEQ